jgi:hypothetical protein
MTKWGHRPFIESWRNFPTTKNAKVSDLHAIYFVRVFEGRKEGRKQIQAFYFCATVLVDNFFWALRCGGNA